MTWNDHDHRGEYAAAGHEHGYYDLAGVAEQHHDAAGPLPTVPPQPDCPPWCDHDTELGYGMGRCHHSAIRRTQEEGYTAVWLFHAIGAGHRPTLTVSGSGCVTVDGKWEAEQLAALIGGLGHAELAALVREAAAEMEQTS